MYDKSNERKTPTFVVAVTLPIMLTFAFRLFISWIIVFPVKYVHCECDYDYDDRNSTLYN